MRISALIILVVALILPLEAAGVEAPAGPVAISYTDTEPTLEDCWACHPCPDQSGEAFAIDLGASTHTTDDPVMGACVSWDDCGGCSANEEDADTELALTELIEAEGEGVVGWIHEFEDDFALALVGDVLQISRKCGQAITWLALSDSEMSSAIELLEQ